MKSDNLKVSGKVDDTMSENANQNIVASLAEKAMSVASPVVPTKKDGGVDQERSIYSYIPMTYMKLHFTCQLLYLRHLYHLEQVGRNVGRSGTERWGSESDRKSCFAVGWYTWGNEFD